MDENGNKKPSVRKLTVKNFSVIKEAELEFGKITVLIGPQASGKSLLCRLAYFFQKTLFDVAGNHAVALLDPDRWNTFLNESLRKAFVAFFPPYSWGAHSFSLVYEDGRYTPRVTRQANATADGVVYNSGDDLRFGFVTNDFYEAFSGFGEFLKESVRDVPSSNLGARLLENTYRASAKLQALQSEPSFSVHSYVPDTRSIFSTSNPSYAAVRIGTSDPVVIDFSRQIDYEYRKSYTSQAGIRCINLMDQERRRILGGDLVRDEMTGDARFMESDGRKLPLTELSSGTRELVPLLTHLSQYVFDENADFQQIIGLPSAGEPTGPPERVIFVEEPESNVFPPTQYSLIRLFVWMANEDRINISWVITTHSPYILTAFNSLLQAWRAGNKQGKRELVSALVPEKYWVNENEFAAYTIRDGVLLPIFQKETEGVEGSGLINGDYLDSVSDEIGGVFDKLLDIEYAG